MKFLPCRFLRKDNLITTCSPYPPPAISSSSHSAALHIVDAVTKFKYLEPSLISYRHTRTRINDSTDRIPHTSSRSHVMACKQSPHHHISKHWRSSIHTQP